MSNSKYTEIAKHLDVDEKTVQQWDKLSKKRNVQRMYRPYWEIAKKILAGICLFVSSFTFITITAMFSPIGDHVQEWLSYLVNYLGIHMDYSPVTLFNLLLAVYAVSVAVIIRTMTYLLDIDPAHYKRTKS